MRLVPTTETDRRGPGWRPPLLRRVRSWLTVRWRGVAGALRLGRGKGSRQRFWKPGDPAENFFRRDAGRDGMKRG